MESPRSDRVAIEAGTEPDLEHRDPKHPIRRFIEHRMPRPLRAVTLRWVLIVRWAIQLREHVGFSKSIRLAWAIREDGPIAGGEPGVIAALDGLGRPDLFYRRSSTDLRTYLQVYLLNGYHFPFDVDPPEVIIDAGANIGYASVWFAERFPHARIIAIEPDHENFEILQLNVRQYSNVTCVQAALSNTAGKLQLIDPGEGPWAYQTRAAQDSTQSITEVDAVTIPELMDRFDLHTIDLLKIDIEGGEASLFSGVIEWVSNVKAMAVELHDRFQPGCSELFEAATTEFTRRATRGEDTFIAR